MEKVCRGCFAEWESDYDRCPKCGWKPDEEPKEMFGIKTGDVLDKRYLVGGIYSVTSSKNAVLWRMYDNLLGTACFALVLKNDDEKRLISAAGSIQKNTCNDNVVVQSLKTIGKHNVLIISVKDRYMDVAEFKKIINDDSDIHHDGLPKPEEKFGKEHVIPPGSLLDGRYRIIDCIGIGGFGITYLCEEMSLHRLVAIKEYYPGGWSERDGTYVAVKSSNMLKPFQYGLKSFINEIKITAKFIHTPHIVTVYDAFEANDTAYMVMEYILGISVGREMRTRGYKPYSEMEVARIIYPVMDALEVMHDHRIIHSDISPGNIMITEDRDVVLIDMGAAKYNLQSQPPLSAAFLKVDYAAPEQYRTAKKGKSDGEGPWTDIYALGATMYYLLTGIKPPDVISRLNGTDTDLTKGLIGKLPLVWVEFIQNSMALEPEQRISSVSALRQLMESIM